VTDHDFNRAVEWHSSHVSFILSHESTGTLEMGPWYVYTITDCYTCLANVAGDRKPPLVATQAVVMSLVEVYFEVVYPIFPFFHKPTLIRKVRWALSRTL